MTVVEEDGLKGKEVWIYLGEREISWDTENLKFGHHLINSNIAIFNSNDKGFRATHAEHKIHGSRDRQLFSSKQTDQNVQGKWESGESLCPVKTLQNYLSRTEEWRKENIESKPCLSFINPHRAVTTSTIARWVKTAFYCRGECIQESTLLIQSGQHLLSMKIDWLNEQCT